MNLELTSPELKKLHKKLSDQFPAHHWNHIDVWAAFWGLVAEINEE